MAQLATETAIFPELLHYARELPWIHIIIVTILSYLVLDSLLVAYFTSLRKLPGHWLARFSRLYKIYLVYDGNSHVKYLDLHRKYGPVVRTGPNHVSVSDPAAIPTIYGITSKFTKVRDAPPHVSEKSTNDNP